jgi:hypothetical protein
MRTQRMTRWLITLAASLVCALASADGEPPPVCARYALRRSHGELEHLELMRTADRVAHRFLERGQHELWERDARGELEHVRSYPAQGKSVHYTSGDLRTINLWPAWDVLAQLVGTRELNALSPAGNKQGFQRMSARVLKGPLRGQPAKVEWLDALALPNKLVLGTGVHRLTMELVGVNADADSCSSEPRLRSLEFADLGDMEYDPFVRSFLAHEAHGHGAHGVH